MTGAAQQALRRTMENYTHICRMILICNYSNQIILPIQSRCVVFRFSKLNEEDIKKRIQYIAEKEKIQLLRRDWIHYTTLRMEIYVEL